MMKRYITVLLMSAGLFAYGQIDSPTGMGSGLDIPFGSSNDDVNIGGSSLSIPNFGLDNPDDKQGFGQYNVTDTISIGETEKEGIKFTTDRGFVDTKTDKAPKYFTKDKEEKDEYRQNQFFGQYSSDAKFVVLRCRDHEFVDGDRVRVYMNGHVLVPNIRLGSGYQDFELFLDPGMNTVEIEALNQGTSGPNTAEFIIIDDDGALLFSNEWNLATGIRAKFIINKPQQ